MPAKTDNANSFDLGAALARLSNESLLGMLAAALEVQECRRVLRKAGLNLVGEVLKGQGDFLEHEHYPRDDVFDAETHGQYYYHSHRGDGLEHGHFHTFLRAAGMPADAAPVTYSGAESWPAGPNALAHLAAISMDAYGEPIGLFTVNRWVCADTWYAAPDVIGMADRFRIDHAFPSWPVNRWLSAMMVLHAPQLEWLLHARDAAVSTWASAHPDRDVFEDRELEITSELPLALEGQLAAIQAELAARNVLESR